MTAPQAEWAQRAVVIGIDPDTKASGMAVAVAGVLRTVGVVPTTGDDIRVECHRVLDHHFRDRGRLACIELPAVRAPGRSPARPADLVALAVVVGRWVQALEERGCEVHLVAPSDWKGSVPKHVTEARLLGGAYRDLPVLSHDERERIPQVERGRVTKEQRGEMIDAVGICMWALGRYR